MISFIVASALWFLAYIILRHNFLVLEQCAKHSNCLYWISCRISSERNIICVYKWTNILYMSITTIGTLWYFIFFFNSWSMPFHFGYNTMYAKMTFVKFQIAVSFNLSCILFDFLNNRLEKNNRLDKK